MSVALSITLLNKVLNILVCVREGQVSYQCGLDVLRRNNLPITLVKQFEAHLGLLIFACLLSNAFVPVVGDYVTNKLEVNCVTFQVIRVRLLQFFFNFTGSHHVETKVLQNVFKEVVGNSVLSLLQVVVEALLQVSCHVRR